MVLMDIKYLYKSNIETDSKTAIIVLPEIFGLTDFVTGVADKFAKEFSTHAYALDFFYQLTGKPNKFDYETDSQKGIELMHRMTGEDFVNIFEQAVDHIAAQIPGLESIIVCGFCFGGRLAYMSATELRVKKIISFYGAGANQANYYSDNSAVELLCETRSNDESLSVLSFFGEDDESISKNDREKTKHSIEESGIKYKEVVYPSTGHAFFNNSRETMYNQESSKKAWQEIVRFLKNK